MEFAAPCYDPLPVFMESKTPAGLYARQKWLGASGAAWRTDFDRTVRHLWDGQRPDGSWGGSAMRTLQRLFGLHLTVRESEARIQAALSWLMDRVWNGAGAGGKTITPEAAAPWLQGLPFVIGDAGILHAAATLFMAAIFQRGDAPAVRGHYDALCARLAGGEGLFPDPGSFSNAFRALVVHPDYAGHPVVARMVAVIGRRQTDDGGWTGLLPFHQTVNALAHLNTEAADRILEAAFRRLRRTQNRDGSWGHAQREWHTFLTVHALKNKGVIALG